MYVKSPVTKDGLLKVKTKCKSILSEYWYISIAALIPFILTFLLYVAKAHYPFGESSVLVIDLSAQYYGFFEALRNFVVEGDSSLLYSFSRSLGGEFMGIFDYYIASPFSYIVCLFPQDRMLEALLCMFMVKAGACGATMAFYLHKCDININRIAIIAFSTMYSLTAYSVVYMHNTMWIDAVIWLPLVMYGVEQLIKYGKYKIYVIFLALTMISQYYIGYMVCIAVLIYFFVYLWGFKSSNNPLDEKYHGMRSFIRIAFYSVIAIGIAAFSIITAYYSLTFGKNEFSDPNWAIESRFTFMELFHKLLPSSYDTAHRGGTPWLYCGVLAILLIPMYFFNKKFKTSEKVAYSVLFTILIFSMATSPLDIIWHGFQKPNELEYRYSFIVCFFMIVLAYRAFANMRYTSRKPIVMSAAFIGFGVMLLEVFYKDVFARIIEIYEEFEVHTFQTVWLTIGCLIIYTLLLCLIPRVKNKELVSCILVFFVCAEVYVSGVSCLNDLGTDWNTFGKSYTTYNNYFDKTRPIVKVVQENDGTFYRMEKTSEKSNNDNMVLELRGLSNSTSTLNADTIYFLRMMGYAARSNKSNYYGGNPVADSIFGIKYIIANKPDFGEIKDPSKYYGEPVYDADDWEHVLDNDEYAVYQNPYALSIAFLAGEGMSEYSIYDYENPFERMNAMISLILGEEETLQVFVPAVPKYPDNMAVDAKGNKISPKTNYTDYIAYEGDNLDLYFHYEVPTNTEMFVFFPTNSYQRKVTLTANGEPAGRFGDTSKDSWNIVSIGEIETKELELKVTIVDDTNKFFLNKGLTKPFVYTIDMDVLADAMTRIQKGNVQIDPEDYREDFLPGTVTTTKDNQLVMTTIPYDKGWQITVDGQKVETIELADALVGYYIPTAGEHEVEMRYMPKEYVIGIAATILFIALFILLIIFEKKLGRVRGYGEFFVIPEKVTVDSEQTDGAELPDQSQGITDQEQDPTDTNQS